MHLQEQQYTVNMNKSRSQNKNSNQSDKDRQKNNSKHKIWAMHSRATDAFPCKYRIATYIVQEDVNITVACP